MTAVAGLPAFPADPVAPAGNDSGVRCSLAPFRGAKSDDVYFVGTTLADTVLVGPGSVNPAQHGGHWGSGHPRPVYGQVIQVTELSAGSAPAGLVDLGADRRIIVVPWDYDPACEPTYWSRSAAWIEAGLEGFYTVRLRPVSAWLEGGRVPVADAFFADIHPYPHGPFFRAGYRGTNALRERPSLTAREYFSLYSILPTLAEIRHNSPDAIVRLQAWKSENPTLASRYPAEQMIAAAKRDLQDHR